ncbi:MAG: histidine phosphatase family protein, partial [Gemmatimonadaceae bacterium]|nr:histidine phosphatase family protein [Gemmatimonadaceae bacterium]
MAASGYDATSEHATSTRLHFVRDGRAFGSDGRCIGHTDLHLSAAGRRACRLLAYAMPEMDVRLISSDLRRAQATAQLLSTAAISTEPRLREMHFGDWDGRSWAELDLET